MKQEIKNIIKSAPPGLYSLVALITILWLTLAPQPLPDNDIPLFEGADKIAHALMFGIFSMAILLDYCRIRGCATPVLWVCGLAAVISALTGVVIEYIQRAMNAGRCFEHADIVADCIGAASGAVIYLFLSKYLSK